MYADLKHRGGQNHREKSCYVASEFIALSLLVKRADQILPEVYCTTLRFILVILLRPFVLLAPKDFMLLDYPIF